jgi:hypothetical protein
VSDLDAAWQSKPSESITAGMEVILEAVIEVGAQVITMAEQVVALTAKVDAAAKDVEKVLDNQLNLWASMNALTEKVVSLEAEARPMIEAVGEMGTKLASGGLMGLFRPQSGH